MLTTLFTAASLLALAGAPAQIPASIDLKDGAEFEGAHSLRYSLSMEGASKRGPFKAADEIGLELKQRLKAGKSADGYRLDLSIREAVLTTRQQDEESAKPRELRWAQPAEGSIDFSLTMNARGGLAGMAPPLRNLFKAAGCSPRLGKIPGVYLPGAGSPLAGSALRGAEPAAEWTSTLKRTFGPLGLLDDFSTFEETWTWKADPSSKGAPRAEGKLSSLKLAQAFGKDSIEILEQSGAETAEFDPATGMLTASKSEFRFKYRYQGQGVDGTGVITRTETYSLRPAAPLK